MKKLLELQNKIKELYKEQIDLLISELKQEYPGEYIFILCFLNDYNDEEYYSSIMINTENNMQDDISNINKITDRVTINEEILPIIDVKYYMSENLKISKQYSFLFTDEFIKHFDEYYGNFLIIKN